MGHHAFSCNFAGSLLIFRFLKNAVQPRLTFCLWPLPKIDLDILSHGLSKSIANKQFYLIYLCTLNETLSHLPLQVPNQYRNNIWGTILLCLGKCFIRLIKNWVREFKSPSKWNLEFILTLRHYLSELFPPYYNFENTEKEKLSKLLSWASNKKKSNSRIKTVKDTLK